MNTPTLLNFKALSSQAHILLPSRLDAGELEHLMTALEGRKVVAIADADYPIPSELITFLEPLQLEALSLSSSDPHLSNVGESIQESLGANGVGIFIPPTVTPTNGDPLDIPVETVRALCQLGIPVAPLAVHRTYLHKIRTDDLADEASSLLAIGATIPPDQLESTRLIQEMLIAIEQCFSNRKYLEGSVAEHLLRSLYTYGTQNTLYDGVDGSKVTYQKLLAGALALSDYVKKHTTKPRVGVILPPGKAGVVANLAIFFAGKIPVNINFTSSREAIKHAIKEADLDIFLTADRVVDNLPVFPWPPREELILLNKMQKLLKTAALKWLVQLRFTSVDKIIEKRGLNLRRNNDEAVLLFTSGSSGVPKGVPLSHRNILANVCQFGTRIKCPPEMTLMGCLPLFHSFGCTVTTLFPLLQGFNLVTYPSPLEAKKIGELIESHNVTLLTATPTFLRGYIKKIPPAQLQGLQYIVTGAEKLPEKLAQSFKERFGSYPLEGYGLTEASPATHLNVPTGQAQVDTTIRPTAKEGTVGIPLVGVAMKSTHPTTGAPQPLSELGCIWIKGANIFSGYLNMPEVNEEVIKDGWFNTGDLGSLDEEGFLKIQGRLSRFSKIGGEMISHEAVEAEIDKVLELDDKGDQKIAIMGVPDEKKGEALILLISIQDYNPSVFISELRQKLLAANVPALWCPRKIVFVPQIPILASGKLDLFSCREAIKNVKLHDKSKPTRTKKK